MPVITTLWKCCVCHANMKNEDFNFFWFPDGSDETWRNKWLTKLELHVGKLMNNERGIICARHFEPTCYDTDGKLIHGSIPTLLLDKISSKTDETVTTVSDSDDDDLPPELYPPETIVRSPDLIDDDETDDLDIPMLTPPADHQERFVFEGTDQGPTPPSGIINHAHSDDDVEKPISNSDGILPSDNIQCDRDEIIVDTPEPTSGPQVASPGTGESGCDVIDGYEIKSFKTLEALTSSLAEALPSSSGEMTVTSTTTILPRSVLRPSLPPSPGTAINQHQIEEMELSPANPVDPQVISKEEQAPNREIIDDTVQQAQLLSTSTKSLTTSLRLISQKPSETHTALRLSGAFSCAESMATAPEVKAVITQCSASSFQGSALNLLSPVHPIEPQFVPAQVVFQFSEQQNNSAGNDNYGSTSPAVELSETNLRQNGLDNKKNGSTNRPSRCFPRGQLMHPPPTAAPIPANSEDSGFIGCHVGTSTTSGKSYSLLHSPHSPEAQQHHVPPSPLIFQTRKSFENQLPSDPAQHQSPFSRSSNRSQEASPSPSKGFVGSVHSPLRRGASRLSRTSFPIVKGNSRGENQSAGLPKFGTAFGKKRVDHFDPIRILSLPCSSQSTPFVTTNSGRYPINYNHNSLQNELEEFETVLAQVSSNTSNQSRVEPRGSDSLPDLDTHTDNCPKSYHPGHVVPVENFPVPILAEAFSVAASTDAITPDQVVIAEYPVSSSRASTKNLLELYPQPLMQQMNPESSTVLQALEVEENGTTSMSTSPTATINEEKIEQMEVCPPNPVKPQFFPTQVVFHSLQPAVVIVAAVQEPLPSSTDTPTTTVKAPQQALDDEHTFLSLQATVEEYEEQLRNSPDRQNNPAKRKLSNRLSSHCTAPKRRKSSQSKEKLLSEHGTACLVGLEGDVCADGTSTPQSGQVNVTKHPMDQQDSMEVMSEPVEKVTSSSNPQEETRNPPSTVQVVNTPLQLSMMVNQMSALSTSSDAMTPATTGTLPSVSATRPMPTVQKLLGTTRGRQIFVPVNTSGLSRSISGALPSATTRYTLVRHIGVSTGQSSFSGSRPYCNTQAVRAVTVTPKTLSTPTIVAISSAPKSAKLPTKESSPFRTSEVMEQPEPTKGQFNASSKAVSAVAMTTKATTGTRFIPTVTQGNLHIPTEQAGLDTVNTLLGSMTSTSPTTTVSNSGSRPDSAAMENCNNSGGSRRSSPFALDYSMASLMSAVAAPSETDMSLSSETEHGESEFLPSADVMGSEMSLSPSSSNSPLGSQYLSSASSSNGLKPSRDRIVDAEGGQRQNTSSKLLQLCRREPRVLLFRSDYGSSECKQTLGNRLPTKQLNTVTSIVALTASDGQPAQLPSRSGSSPPISQDLLTVSLKQGEGDVIMPMDQSSTPLSPGPPANSLISCENEYCAFGCVCESLLSQRKPTRTSNVSIMNPIDSSVRKKINDHTREFSILTKQQVLRAAFHALSEIEDIRERNNAFTRLSNKLRDEVEESLYTKENSQENSQLLTLSTHLGMDGMPMSETSLDKLSESCDKNNPIEFLSKLLPKMFPLSHLAHGPVLQENQMEEIISATINRFPTFKCYSNEQKKERGRPRTLTTAKVQEFIRDIFASYRE